MEAQGGPSSGLLLSSTKHNRGFLSGALPAAPVALYKRHALTIGIRVISVAKRAYCVQVACEKRAMSTRQRINKRGERTSAHAKTPQTIFLAFIVVTWAARKTLERECPRLPARGETKRSTCK